MTKTEVLQSIVDVLSFVQSMSGRKPVNIAPNTCPIGDLEQFDSLNGVEATVELSTRLGIELPGSNAFVNGDGTKALTVSEIADAILQLAGAA